jgi:hypothetical protein
VTAPAVYAAIAAVQAALAKQGIAKDRRNQQQGFAFRGIDDVYHAIAGLLPAHGLCILPRILSRECLERATRNGGVMYYVTVEAEFDFVATADGSKHTVRTYGEASDSGDKASNKAMSAAMKYAVLMTFTVPTEGDNDADATTPPESAPAAPAPPAITPQAWALEEMRRLDAMVKRGDVEGVGAWAAAEAKAIARLQKVAPEEHEKLMRFYGETMAAIRAAG